MPNFNCIERRLSKVFYQYGVFIARHPAWFITLPVLVAIVFGGGFFFRKSETSTEYLFTPTNGPAKSERDVIKALFPVNDSGQFDRLRLSDLGTYGSVIVTSSDRKSILRENILRRVKEVDDFVHNISVVNDVETYSFRNICAKWKNTCADQTILTLLHTETASNLNLTFPYYVLKIPGIPSSPILGYPVQSKHKVPLHGVLGGVETDASQRIISVKAFKLSYYINAENRTKASKWIDEFLKAFKSIQIKDIELSHFTSATLEEELQEASGQTVSLISVVFTIMITFSIVSCVMFDWVLSKPWLGFLGVISVALSILSTFGMLMYCGVPFISIVGVTPFVSLAVGVDDMFVLLAAWRQTDPRQTVEHRLGETFSEAVISITITTVTDALAFGIGAITFYPSVQIFCAYTGLSIVLDFIYQITFFGGCMALTGKREHQNRHSYTCMRVLPKAEAGSKSLCYRLFCAAGYPFNSPTVDANGADDIEAPLVPHAGVTFFQNYYGPFIMKIPVKVSTILLYFAYLGVAIYGCTQVREGLDLRKLALDNSYAIKFYDVDEKYYDVYQGSVMVVIRKKVDYTSPATLGEINNLVDDLESTGYFAGRDLVVSWIHDYLTYLNDHDIKYDDQNFTKILVDRFLLEPAFVKYELDIVFNEDKTSVSQCRIFVQSVNMTNSTRDRYMMSAARDLTRKSSLDALAYHPAFIYFDQYETVLANTLQNVGIAIGCMLVVSLILIPDIVVSFWVFLGITSICTGILGFMTLWNENVDTITMICIVMSIGFSVDFSAHIAYAFSVSRQQDPKARVCDALGSVGLPITQGAFSTLLGFVMLSSAPSHIFRIYFKIILLVIVIGFLHGILILPTFMSITGRQIATEVNIKASEVPQTDENERSDRCE